MLLLIGVVVGYVLGVNRSGPTQGLSHPMMTIDGNGAVTFDNGVLSWPHGFAVTWHSPQAAPSRTVDGYTFPAGTASNKKFLWLFDQGTMVYFAGPQASAASADFCGQSKMPPPPPPPEVPLYAQWQDGQPTWYVDSKNAAYFEQAQRDPVQIPSLNGWAYIDKAGKNVLLFVAGDKPQPLPKSFTSYCAAGNTFTPP